MSHRFYNRLWREAMHELAQLVEVESLPRLDGADQAALGGATEAPKVIEWDEATKHFAGLYLGYLSVYRKLVSRVSPGPFFSQGRGIFRAEF